MDASWKCGRNSERSSRTLPELGEQLTPRARGEGDLGITRKSGGGVVAGHGVAPLQTGRPPC